MLLAVMLMTCLLIIATAMPVTFSCLTSFGLEIILKKLHILFGGQNRLHLCKELFSAFLTFCHPVLTTGLCGSLCLV